ncbi:MAG: hypothetical protein HC836_23125 [Richelia sp. RM2_1_2]|nr:hypothetical protein [Richelia sp. RM2_1_2]
MGQAAIKKIPTIHPVLYILARSYATDLPSCNPGKLAAQVSHASNAFIHTMNSNSSSSSPDQARYKELCECWTLQSNQGFGTVLVLAVNEDQMNAAVTVATAVGLPAGIVNDPTYPYRVDNEAAQFVDPMYHTFDPIPGDGFTTLFRSENTCAWVFGLKGDVLLKAVVGKFPLHP